MKRRTFVAALLPSVLMVASASAHSGALPSAEVWKSPVCGCCKDWVAHLQANGFPVKGNDSGNKEARAKKRVRDWACRSRKCCLFSGTAAPAATKPTVKETS